MKTKCINFETNSVNKANSVFIFTGKNFKILKKELNKFILVILYCKRLMYITIV